MKGAEEPIMPLRPVSWRGGGQRGEHARGAVHVGMICPSVHPSVRPSGRDGDAI